MELAIVMCGGRGKRLGFVEKPMLEIKGRKLIEYAIEEIEIANLDAIFVTSHFTKNTEKFLRKEGKEVFRADGSGYMDDLICAIESYKIIKPIINMNSDLYIARKGILSDFVKFYLSSDLPAASMVYRNGRRVGINAFDPFFFKQKEEKFIIDERDIVNIDTPEDLERVRNEGKEGRIF